MKPKRERCYVLCGTKLRRSLGGCGELAIGIRIRLDPNKRDRQERKHLVLELF